MKVFLVNLDRDRDRLASVDRQLKHLGVEYTRIPAVYGKDLSANYIKAHFDAFRWWCAMGRPVASAEIGCALSHYNVYQRMVDDENLPYCCILEDDVSLSSHFWLTLQEIERWLNPSKPQVIILNDHENRRGNLPAGIHRSYSGLCTDGYVLTRVAAKSLLEANLPIVVPCDAWRRWVRQGRIDLYHAAPAVVRQMQEIFGSSTTENRVDVSKVSLARWFFHKAKRVIGKALDFCFIKATGR